MIVYTIRFYHMLLKNSSTKPILMILTVDIRSSDIYNKYEIFADCEKNMIRNSKNKTLLFAFILFVALLIVTAFTVTAFADIDNTENNIEASNSESELTSLYRPKISITLNSELELNVYVPAENTVSFTFDGDFYYGLENYGNTIYLNNVKIFGRQNIAGGPGRRCRPHR